MTDLDPIDVALRKHGLLSDAAIRPVGTPPSGCRGEIIRVAPDGSPLPWADPGVLDPCQQDEGELWQFAEIRLYKCCYCRHTIVVAICSDKSVRIRNAWKKSDATELAAVA